MAGNEKYLFQAVKIIIENMKFGFDITKKGRVVSCDTSTSSNIYQVQIQGKDYRVQSKFNFNIGETVFVLFPQGNETDLYLYPNQLT